MRKAHWGLNPHLICGIPLATHALASTAPFERAPARAAAAPGAALIHAETSNEIPPPPSTAGDVTSLRCTIKYYRGKFINGVFLWCPRGVEGLH
ncbi:hypothetical protein JYU34_019071 [Plutella xylostella]|uniref:Secreted protein n=1 Tax=Plutella xylostella TaxID=51655 RepID=A0ABQ7PZC4_PLUXY|nr:hypothetical protein JYU34_019071 [Plutella xylostella]